MWMIGPDEASVAHMVAEMLHSTWSVRTSVHSVDGIGLNCRQCCEQKGRGCLGHLPKASNCLVRCPCQVHSHYALRTPINWWMSRSMESDPLTFTWTGTACLSSRATVWSWADDVEMPSVFHVLASIYIWWELRTVKKIYALVTFELHVSVWTQITLLMLVP